MISPYISNVLTRFCTAICEWRHCNWWWWWWWWHRHYYRVSHNWVFTFFLLFCWLLLILISKVGIVLENSGNLLHDRHKNFENRFRNGLDNWGQSCHPSFWYLQFVITQRQQNDFHVKVGNFDLNYLSHFWIDFQNLCAYHVANVLNLSKLPQLLQLGWVEAGKITETKWILNCGTPCTLCRKLKM